MFFQEKLEAVQRYFVYGVLPEIIGKWYTRKPVANSEGVVLDPNHLLIPQVTDYEDSPNSGVIATHQVMER